MFCARIQCFKSKPKGYTMTKKLLFVGTMCLVFAFSACQDAPKEQNANSANAQTTTEQSPAAHSGHGSMQHGAMQNKAGHNCAHRDGNASSGHSGMQHGGHGGHKGHGKAHTFSDTDSGKMLAAMHAPMMQQKPSRSKSAEIDFITDMIPHHQGAIDSAKLTLPHAKGNAELETLLNNIITSQTKEIADFNALLAGGKLSKTELSDEAYKEFFKKNRRAMRAMMKDMTTESGNVQKDFLVGMIAHHQGAVDVSKILLDYSKDETVRKIAQNIIAAQEAEIKQMGEMIKRLK